MGQAFEKASKRQFFIQLYLNAKLTRQEACEKMEISERQLSRLIKKWKNVGPKFILHGNKGKIPTNKISKALAAKLVNIYCNNFRGFNITHFREELITQKLFDNIPSEPTLRRILRQEQVIPAQTQHRKKVRRLRPRSNKKGLMVQIDGSHHAWFSLRLCCLTLAIDDATSEILAAKFTPTETTFAAMDVIEMIFYKYGMFECLYSDKAGIYSNSKRVGYTNLERALESLGILMLLANTPQGKGRVERVFRTLQSRLVNEMRQQKVSSLEEANEFLKDYIPKHNNRFSVPPINPEAGFKPLPINFEADNYFYFLEIRIVAIGE